MTQCGDKLLDNPILPDSAIAELVLSSVIAFFSIIIMFAAFQNIDSEGSSKYSVLLTVLNLICTAFTIYIYVECVQREPDAGTLDKSDLITCIVVLKIIIRVEVLYILLSIYSVS